MTAIPLLQCTGLYILYMAMESKHLRLYFVVARIISGGVWSWNLGGGVCIGGATHIFLGGDKIEILEIPPPHC